MTEKFQTGREDFEALLDWLDADRAEAGRKYESIRARLIKIFHARQCPAAEELTDLTIERVTAKASRLVVQYRGKPELYFYGVAKRVFWEYAKKPADQPLPARLPAAAKEEDGENESLVNYYDCLEKCLARMPADRRLLIIQYYEGDKHSKIARHKKIAQKLGVSSETLRVRALRIRTAIRKCVLDCVGENFK